MNNPVKIKTVVALTKSLFPTKNADFENLRNLLDQVCSQVAQRFNLYGLNGKPRKATVISIISRSTCVACLAKRLSAQPTANCVDALYTECHRLAVDILVEELYNILREIGCNVIISTETELEYGKADVTITITNYGLNLKSNANEILVEVKTGSSLSLCQLFRYLIDKRNNTIVVWRVRRRQILVFNTESIRPLLTEFMRTICLRGNRLLSSSELTCQHKQRPDYQPTQEALQTMLQDFAEGLIETLPNILEAITERLEVKGSEVKP
jgi:hypothetical protein